MPSRLGNEMVWIPQTWFHHTYVAKIRQDKGENMIKHQQVPLEKVLKSRESIHPKVSVLGAPFT